MFKLNEYFEFEPQSVCHAVEGGYGGGSFSRLSNELERTAIYFGAATQSAQTFASTISAFTEFDKQLRLTNAVADGTAQSFEAMRKAALEFSTSTTTSATQAASAMYFLASAGFSVKESVQAMGAVLLLAQGTLSDVGHTADTVAAAISSFGLKAADAGQVADIMAASVSKSQGTMEKLAYALRQVGPVAEYVGMSFRETATQLSLLFNAGLRGEQAGTALRNSLLRLASPTQIAADELRALGVKTIDPLSLKVLAFKDILEQLATKNLGPQIIKSLVGDESAAGFTILLGSVKVRTDATKQIVEADAKFKEAMAKSGGVTNPDTELAKSKVDSLKSAYDKMYEDLDPTKHSSLQMAREQMMSFGAQIDLAKNQMSAFGMAIGEASLRAVLPFVSALGTLGMKLSELGPKQQEGIVQFAALSAALVLTVTNFKKLEDGIKTVITLNAAQWATGAANGLTGLGNSARTAATTVANVAGAGSAGSGASAVSVALLQERRAQQLLANRITADTLPLAEILAGGTALSGVGIAALRRSNTPLSQVEGVGRNAPGPWMQNIMASTGYGLGRTLTAEEEAARGPGSRAPSNTATVGVGVSRAATQAETEIVALGRSAAGAGAELRATETAAAATGIGFLGWAAKLSVITLVGSELVGMFASLYKAVQNDKDFVYFDADAYKKSGEATLRAIETERRNTGNNARALESLLTSHDQAGNERQSYLRDLSDPKNPLNLLTPDNNTAMEASLKYIAEELKKSGTNAADIADAQASFKRGGDTTTYATGGEGGGFNLTTYGSLTDEQVKEAKHQGELTNNHLQKAIDHLAGISGYDAKILAGIESIKKEAPQLAEKISKAYTEQKAAEAKSNDPSQIDAISTIKMQNDMKAREASTEASAEQEARRLMGGDPRAIYQELLAQNTSQLKQSITTLLGEINTGLKANEMFKNFNTEGMLGIGNQSGYINTVNSVVDMRRARQAAPGSIDIGTGAGGPFFDAVSRAEGTMTDQGINYNSVLGTPKGGGPSSIANPPKQLIDMTLQEVNEWSKNVLQPASGKDSSAVGAFQILGNSNIPKLAQALGLDMNNTKFDPNIQRQMATQLGRTQGVNVGTWAGFGPHPDQLAIAQQSFAGGSPTISGADPSMGAAAVMTGNAWRTTPIGGGNMPGMPGSQPLNVKLQASDFTVIGDSLGVGIKNAGVTNANVKGSENENAVLKRIQATSEEAIKGRQVILSTGASNDPKGQYFDVIADQLEELKKKGAAGVNVLGVGPGPGGKFDANRYNTIIGQTASNYGARFDGPLQGPFDAEGIHPGPAEYRRQLGLATSGTAANGTQQTFASGAASVPGLPGVQQGVGAYTLSPEAEKRVQDIANTVMGNVLANRAKADLDKNPSMTRISDEQIASFRVDLTNVLRGGEFRDVNAIDQANRAEKQRSQAAFNQQRGLTTAQQDTAVARATVEPGNIEGVAQAQINKDIADRFTKMQNMIFNERNQAIIERRPPNFAFLQQYQTTENEGAVIRARQINQAVPGQKLEYRTGLEVPVDRGGVDVSQLTAGRASFNQDYGSTATALQSQSTSQISLDFTNKTLAVEKELADFRNNTKYNQQDQQVKSHIADLVKETDLIKQQRDQELALANSAEGRAKAQHDATISIAADFTKQSEYSDNFFKGLQGGAKDWISQQKTMFDTGKDAFKTFADGIGNSFADLFTNGALGPKKALATISSTLNDLSKMMLKSVFNQAIVNPLMSAIGGGDNSGSGPAGSKNTGITGGSGSSSGGILDSITNLLSGKAIGGAFDGVYKSVIGDAATSGIASAYATDYGTSLASDLALGLNALGNVYMNGRITRFAQGGTFTNTIVTAPTAFPMSGGGSGLMGEAGPEAIMPLKRTSSGALGIAGGSGHSINYQPAIQINLGGGQQQGKPDPRTAAALTDQLHAATKAAVIDTVRNEQRPGGMLYGQANGTS